MNNRSSIGKFKLYILFLYIFLCTGFILGTLTLALIIESVVNYIRQNGWMYNYENVIVIVIIIIYVIYSFLISKWFTLLFLNLSRISKVLFLFVLTLVTIFCLNYWLHPKSGEIDKNYLISEDGRFIAGPYPDGEKMVILKKKNYAGIISLLSPYVLPFEPILIDEENKLAKRFGIPVIRIPMLPWISKNTAAINKIKELAQAKNNNKYYVHCYYGRDRVSLFIRVANQFSYTTVKKNNTANFDAKQQIAIKHIPFERGVGYAINENAIFGPMPTEDEFLNTVVVIDNPYFTTPIRSVISIQSETSLFTDEEKSLIHYGINFNRFIADATPYDPDKILSIAKQIKSYPGPVLVYSFYVDPSPMPIILEGVMLSYITDRPSLPRQLFVDSMTNGKVEVLAPNIVIGHSPTNTEYKNYLFFLGIRAIAYIDDCNQKTYEPDRFAAHAANLRFYCFAPSDPKLLPFISEGGPWYVYGPKLQLVSDILKKQFHYPTTKLVVGK